MNKHSVSTADMPRSRRPTGRFAKLMLSVASLMVTLLVIEAAMRISGAEPQTATVLSTFFQYDERSGWRGKPDAVSRFTTMNFDVFVSHDRDGFRRSGYDLPIATDATSKDPIVWVLGDSGTWGWGVDDGKTYVELLNKMSDDGTRYRNLGHCGFSSVQQYLLLKDLFEKGMKPKEVVVMECNNDLTENLDSRNQSPARAYLAVSGDDVELMNYPTPRQGWGLLVWLKNNSLVWNHAHYYVRRAILMHHERKLAAQIADEAKQPAAPATVAAEKTNAEPVKSNAAESSAAKVSAEADPFAPFSREEMVGLKHSYRMMRDLCAKHDVKLRIVNEGGPWVPSACDELGVVWLSTNEPWLRHKTGPQASQPTSFKTDPHFNELGHRLLAEAIHAERKRVNAAEAAVPAVARSSDAARSAAAATTKAR